MMNQTEISRLRRSINTGLTDLQQKALLLRDVEADLHQVRSEMESALKSNFVTPVNPRTVDVIKYVDRCNRMQSHRDMTLRKMDVIAAKVAGYITVLIEECVSNHRLDLRYFIRSAIESIGAAYCIQLPGNRDQELPVSPAAIGILTPYLIKSRVDEEQPLLFAGIRNAIRSLAR